jgi:hypothetical protein
MLLFFYSISFFNLWFVRDWVFWFFMYGAYDWITRVTGLKSWQGSISFFLFIFSSNFIVRYWFFLLKKWFCSFLRFISSYPDLITQAANLTGWLRLAQPLLPRLHIYHATPGWLKLVFFLFFIQFHPYKVFFQVVMSWSLFFLLFMCLLSLLFFYLLLKIKPTY